MMQRLMLQTPLGDQYLDRYFFGACRFHGHTLPHRPVTPAQFPCPDCCPRWHLVGSGAEFQCFGQAMKLVQQLRATQGADLDQEDEDYDDCYPDGYGIDDEALIDGVGFADPRGHSALRAATSDNPRCHPCPTCGTPNVLTPLDVARHYQCDRCADQVERGGY